MSHGSNKSYKELVDVRAENLIITEWEEGKTQLGDISRFTHIESSSPPSLVNNISLPFIAVQTPLVWRTLYFGVFTPSEKVIFIYGPISYSFRTISISWM